MTSLRVEGAADLAGNLLANPFQRNRVEEVLNAAGATAAEALCMVGAGAEWTHTVAFRCEPTGRQVAGLEVATIMDSHDQLEGTMFVGSRQRDVDALADLLDDQDAEVDPAVRELAQETTNILGSAYLNGLRSEIGDAQFSDRCFLPSPPRFLRSSVETMLELAVGGQGLGDRGWIADHRLRSGSLTLVLVWIPTSEALLSLAAGGEESVL